jgi:hypothetical protein
MMTDTFQLRVFLNCSRLCVLVVTSALHTTYVRYIEYYLPIYAENTQEIVCGFSENTLV